MGALASQSSCVTLCLVPWNLAACVDSLGGPLAQIWALRAVPRPSL